MKLYVGRIEYDEDLVIIADTEEKAIAAVSEACDREKWPDFPHECPDTHYCSVVEVELNQPIGVVQQ